MKTYSDEKILDSWEKNVSQWTSAVRHGRIDSRELVTNQAIVDAVLDQSPESVVDIGCGEGWLVRELSPRVQKLLGVDAVPALIEQAMTAGRGDYRVASYDAISKGELGCLFDVAVCNFSLLGKESVDDLFSNTPYFLKPGGVFVVQTLHPVITCDGFPYMDGWREGSWLGFDAGFVDPAPWYFRTLETWNALFSANGLRLLDLREPIHPVTQQPASIIFIGKNTDKQ